LEDFFAKRDKKKKGQKGQKFETTGLDDVAKILDAKVKERKKQETNKSTYQVPVSDTPDQPATDYRANEDDEWKEIVEEKPDYTGLKIQELILEDEDELGGKDGTGQDDGDKPKEGAWIKKRTPQPEPTPTPVPVPAPVEEEKVPPSESPVPSTEDIHIPDGEIETPEEIPTVTPTEPEEQPKNVYVPMAVRKARAEAAAKEAALASSIAAATSGSTIPRPASSSATPATPATPTDSKPGGAYVPPSRRGLTPGSTSSGPSKPKKHVAAPNINDEQYFPSLGGDVPLKHS